MSSTTNNFDKQVFVNKHWPLDPWWIGYMKPIKFAFACEMESKLTIELKVELRLN